VNRVNLYGDLNVFGDATVNELTSLSSITTGLLTFNGEDNSINVIGGEALKIQNKLGAGGIEFLDGKLVMTADGSLISEGDIKARKVAAEEFAVKGAATVNQGGNVTPTDATIGEGAIETGTKKVTIENTHVDADVKIFVTATSDTGGQALVVTEKADGSFAVSVKNTALQDITFDYWIVKVE
jgi:hypothetical protein